MPFEIEAFPDLIWIKLHGDVTAAEFHRHAGEVALLERANTSSPHRFTDLSGAKSFPNFEGMLNFAALRSEAKLRNDVKSAVYAATDLQFGVARMFQKLNRNPKIEVNVFRDKTEALKWVGWAVQE